MASVVNVNGAPEISNPFSDYDKMAMDSAMLDHLLQQNSEARDMQHSKIMAANALNMAKAKYADLNGLAQLNMLKAKQPLMDQQANLAGIRAKYLPQQVHNQTLQAQNAVKKLSDNYQNSLKVRDYIRQKSSTPQDVRTNLYANKNYADRDVGLTQSLLSSLKQGNAPTTDNTDLIQSIVNSAKDKVNKSLVSNRATQNKEAAMQSDKLFKDPELLKSVDILIANANPHGYKKTGSWFSGLAYPEEYQKYQNAKNIVTSYFGNLIGKNKGLPAAIQAIEMQEKMFEPIYSQLSNTSHAARKAFESLRRANVRESKTNIDVASPIYKPKVKSNLHDILNSFYEEGN